MKQYLKKHIFELMLYLVLFAGLCLMLYPTVSNWWNARHQTRAVSEYIQSVETVSDEDKTAMLAAARAYNARLAGEDTNFLLEEDQQLEYESLLDVSGTGVMGRIRIPAINVDLPIYHTVEETVLQVGIGHIPGSSLPVGGPGTHSLLSGHRGLPSSRLFTDLNQMQVGDVFIINVLNETLTYQVDQIRIVLPEEVDELSITPGKDYVTLITCTPYGINTHRILVRGHRIDNLTDTSLAVVAEARRVPVRYVAVAIAVPLLALTALGMVLVSALRKPRKSNQELLQSLHQTPAEGEPKPPKPDPGKDDPKT